MLSLFIWFYKLCNGGLFPVFLCDLFGFGFGILLDTETKN